MIVDSYKAGICFMVKFLSTFNLPSNCRRDASVKTHWYAYAVYSKGKQV